MPLRPLHILTKRILLNAKVHRRSSRCQSNSQVGIASLRPRKEEQMRHTQRTTHDHIILQSVASPLLQSRRRPGLHDFSHIRRKLADAGSHFSGSNSDDHALGVARRSMAGVGDLLVVRPDMGSLLDSFSCHFFGEMKLGSQIGYAGSSEAGSCRRIKKKKFGGDW